MTHEKNTTDAHARKAAPTGDPLSGPHAHGGDRLRMAEAAGREAASLLDFSVNIRPEGPPDFIRRALFRAMSGLDAYPSPHAEEACRAAARHHGLDAARFVFGNGSNELIHALARALKKRGVPGVCIVEPAFSEYGLACRRAGLDVRRVWGGIAGAANGAGARLEEGKGNLCEERLPLLFPKPHPLPSSDVSKRQHGGRGPEDEESGCAKGRACEDGLLAALEDAPAGWAVFLANPGNPSGLFRPAEDCLGLMAQRPDLLWILDEAFIEYAGPEETASALRRLPANGAVLRSLTKFHAVPGVRLGYLAASPEMAEAVRGEIPAWSVNAFAIAAALAVFTDHSDYAERTRAENDERRADLAAALSALPGVEVYPSAANYLLFRWPHPLPLGSILLKRFGIALRDCSNYHGLGQGWYRAAVRFPEEHRRLADALRAVLETAAPDSLSEKASPAPFPSAFPSSFPGQDSLPAFPERMRFESGQPFNENAALTRRQERGPVPASDAVVGSRGHEIDPLHGGIDPANAPRLPHQTPHAAPPSSPLNSDSICPTAYPSAPSPRDAAFPPRQPLPSLADRDSITSKVLGKRGDGGPGEGERTTLLQKGFLSPSPGGTAPSLPPSLSPAPSPSRRRTPALMLQGTSSNAGKSVLAAAFCRIFRQDGYDVAPFKAQNMSLNSGVTATGDEMGRAQIVQAQAARVDPDARMNPILLKPHSDTGSQVVVLGQPAGHMGAVEYFQKKRDLWPTVREAYDGLAAAHEIMVLEGAGSPGEINLKGHDLVNMRMAGYAGASVLLVGDIDRGGVYASFLGTWMTFSAPERRLLAGYLVNRFRGDASLLGPAHHYMLDCTGVPVLGAIPYIRDLNLPEEDMAGFPWGGRPDDGPKEPGTLDIAVVMPRHVSNYTDFAPLGLEPDVRLRPVRRPEDWGRPDVVMLPGSKSVVADLEDLRRSGLADRILEHAARGGWLFGICGGLQMLGRDILDPCGVESSAPRTPGLGLMDLRSTFAAGKTLVRVARAETPLGVDSGGYEIHHGQTEHGPSARPLFLRADRAYAEPAERVCGYADGRRWATYLHGVFDDDAFRRAWLDHVRADIGLTPQGRPLASYDLEKALDRLADIVREHCDLSTIYRSMGL